MCFFSDTYNKKACADNSGLVADVEVGGEARREPVAIRRARPLTYVADTLFVLWVQLIKKNTNKYYKYRIVFRPFGNNSFVVRSSQTTNKGSKASALATAVDKIFLLPYSPKDQNITYIFCYIELHPAFLLHNGQIY